jgi:hypothetical protein
MVLTWRIHRHKATRPATDAEWAESAAREAAMPAAFDEVIALHLAALGLPFKPPWLEGTWDDYEPA